MYDNKISVIVPVYNIGQYLESSIKSLINQTYRNIEIILVDDGSVDNSPAICDLYAEKDNRIKVIHQKNKGVSAARNAGMRVATGDYIGFCDGDDVPDVDMFEFLMNIAVKDNADISICEVRFEFEDGTVRNIATGKSKIWNNNESFLCDFFKGNVGMSTYTKLFKAKVCRGVEYPENCKTNEDKYFCFLAALNSNTFSSKSVAKYTYYRREGSSSITEFTEKYFDCIYLADKMLETVSKEHPSIYANAVCNRLSTTLRIYKLMYMRNGLKKFSSQGNELVKYVKSFDKATAKKYLSKKDYIDIYAVNAETAKIIPIFLISVPFVAITRISTAGFYATEKAVSSYILTFIEPVLMLVLMLILPPLLGGQIMIWWSTVFVRIISAVLAIFMTKLSNRIF